VANDLQKLNYFLYSFAGIAFLYTILVLIGMKDVINSKEFDVRRERSGSQNGKTRAIFVVK
jgi:hypothetical protein